MFQYKHRHTHKAITPSTFLSKPVRNHLTALVRKINSCNSPERRLSAFCQLSVFFAMPVFQKSIWFLSFFSAAAKEQTDVIAISLGERHTDVSTRLDFYSPRVVWANRGLPEKPMWLSSDPGTRLHGVAPGLQTDRDSSSHYKSGSDHPNMENK